MEILFVIILILIYLSIGFCSFVYWWTKDYDFAANDIWFAFFVSFFGPLSFIAGWTIHGNFNKIIIRRNKKPNKTITTKKEI